MPEPGSNEADPRGNTRMISSIIKEVRQYKEMLKNNQDFKQEQDKAL